MEITIIHGQQHKGSTYHISREILERMKDENTTVHEFFMIQDTPDYCRGCFNCIYKGETHCPHFDKVQPILSAMETSEVFIIDSPTYCFEMTGQLKTFFDHLAFMWLPHRPNKTMFHKVAIVISTAAGAGAKRVTKSLANQLFWIGVPTVYQYSENVKASNWESVSDEMKLKINNNCKRLSEKAKAKTGKAKPGIKLRFMFNVMKKMQMKEEWNAIDQTHWKENGWLDGKPPW